MALWKWGEMLCWYRLYACPASSDNVLRRAGRARLDVLVRVHDSVLRYMSAAVKLA